MKIIRLRIIDHPQFVQASGHVSTDLLAMDRLHLGFKGTEIVVSNIESAILELKSSKTQNCVNSEVMITDIESGVNRVSERLLYSGVGRFGETQEEPVLKVLSQKERNSSFGRPSRLHRMTRCLKEVT